MNKQDQVMFQRAIQAYQQGYLSDAEKILNHCVNLNGNNFDVLYLLAIVCAGQDKHKEAIKYFRKAIKLSPNNPEALSNFGTSLTVVGNNQEALSVFQKAIKIDYNNAIFWFNAGNALHEMGQHKDALDYYEKSIALNPNLYQAHFNYGKAFCDLKRYSDALRHFEKSIELSPNIADLWFAKGVVAHALKQYDEAIASYDKALTLNSDYAKAWFNKGNLLHELRSFEESLTHYDKALNLNPNYSEAWCNKAGALFELKRYEEALLHYDKALKLNIDFPEAWANKGQTLHSLKRHREAIEHIDKAISLKSDIDWLDGDLLHIKMSICDWSDLSNSLEKIIKKINAHEKFITPFSLLSIIDNPLQHKKATEIYIKSKIQANLVLESFNNNRNTKKLRIGYFSADFKKHAVSYLIAELIELHDKNIFDIIAFSFGEDDKSPLRLRLVETFTKFIDVRGMSDSQIAELSRRNKIDIAIDLNGLSGGARPGIFSYRAAPIQVNWLGYPGTMATEHIDYIISDKTIIPESFQKFYSEKVVYLPNTYMVDDSMRTASSKKYSREECGLPENAFIFCCFNNHYKFNPQVLDGWTSILRKVESSVMWIAENNDEFKVNISTEFKKRGVNLEKIIFAKRVESMGDHLSRLSLADIFLDTYPYNAHSTALDSLKAGVPVLTLIGQSFASRVSASLLNAIGLSELITNDQEQYENLAVELSTSAEKLSELKKKLSRNRFSEPLFNTPLFTKHIESAYIKMFERYQVDLQPDNIFVIQEV
jgi:predicted O-linked N-acetylglucosamine transferase (SPINDLY family)